MSVSRGRIQETDASWSTAKRWLRDSHWAVWLFLGVMSVLAVFSVALTYALFDLLLSFPPLMLVVLLAVLALGFWWLCHFLFHVIGAPGDVGDRSPRSWRTRATRAAVLLAAVGVGWQAPVIGLHAKLLMNLSDYTASVDEALATAAAGEQAFGPVIVDESDEPPVRAVIPWFAAHGDWQGQFYDPTGRVAVDHMGFSIIAGPLSVRHVFGPWYFVMTTH
ncbi:MAG: hypothetical protein RL885_28645 [Planctomycetota bacterium]